MTVRIKTITFDCAHPYPLSQFWTQLTGFAEDPDDPNLPEHTECLLVSPDFPIRLLFIAVPEAKGGKNRVHLDLAPVDRTRDEEVERVVGLGAQVFEDHRRPDGTGWVVLTDPEGNEFCIERSDAERAAAAAT